MNPILLPSHQPIAPPRVAPISTSIFAIGVFPSRLEHQRSLAYADTRHVPGGAPDSSWRRNSASSECPFDSAMRPSGPISHSS